MHAALSCRVPAAANCIFQGCCQVQTSKLLLLTRGKKHQAPAEHEQDLGLLNVCDQLLAPPSDTL